MALLLTVERAGEVLRAFTPRTPAWGPTAMAARLGCAKSKTHLLLASLTAVDLLERCPGGQYRVGPRVLELHATLRATDPLRAAAFSAAAARELDPELSLGLVELTDTGLRTVDAVQLGLSPYATLPRVGEPCAHAHADAAGLALLALLDRGEQLRALTRSLPRLTSRTKVEFPALRDELKRIGVSGYALELGAVNPQRASLAVGLQHPTTGRSLATVVSGPLPALRRHVAPLQDLLDAIAVEALLTVELWEDCPASRFSAHQLVEAGRTGRPVAQSVREASRRRASRAG